MVTEQGIRRVLAKCSGYDPTHFPQFSQVILGAWIEHFSQFELLSDDDALAGVAAYYQRPQRPVPQPADISFYARQILRDRSDFDAAFEALCDRKAGDTERPRQLEPNLDPEVVQARKDAVTRFAFSPKAIERGDYLQGVARAQRRLGPPAPMPDEEVDTC